MPPRRMDCLPFGSSAVIAAFCLGDFERYMLKVNGQLIAVRPGQAFVGSGIIRCIGSRSEGPCQNPYDGKGLDEGLTLVIAHDLYGRSAATCEQLYDFKATGFRIVKEVSSWGFSSWYSVPNPSWEQLDTAERDQMLSYVKREVGSGEGKAMVLADTVNGT